MKPQASSPPTRPHGRTARATTPRHGYQRGRLLLKLLGALLLALALLAAALALNAWRLGQRQQPVAARPGVAVDAAAAAQRLSAAVRLQTISTPDNTHAAQFEALHALLQASYPRAHAVLQRERIGRHALLYTWPGQDPQAAPVALLAHQDVVPVAPGTERDWVRPPFSGAVHDGHVWGRGAWDDKASLMAMLEAVEALAASGFRPRQTVYLAFGADEELGGEDGAMRIAALMKSRGVRLRFVLDEGMLITHGLVPGVQRPVALIGLAEKGFLTLRLTARGAAGHSSMPPPRSSIGVLGEAIARIESRPMPARLDGLPRAMLEAVAPHADTPYRLLLGNLWLTAPLVERVLEKSPSANATLRTTGIATVARAGERDNVLAGVAQASLNFRLLPGDRSEDVQRRVQALVADLGVTVERAPYGTEASAVSPHEAPDFTLIERTLRELQPDVVVAPGLLVGGTDSRHFAGVADAIFRFVPVHATAADLARFHGTNERIAVANHVQIIQFYERLLRQLAER